MSAALVPAATVLRQLPGHTIVVGSSPVAHLYATETRNRCGAPVAIEAEVIEVAEDVDQVPAVRMCARCIVSLPRDAFAALQPELHELAAVHSRQAREAAQRCIDELEQIRRRMRVDGTGMVLTVLVKAKPAKDPHAPRPKTRAERDRQHTGHVAAETTMSMAALLNLLTPGGYAPDHRLYLLNPPAPGTRVDPQARR